MNAYKQLTEQDIIDMIGDYYDGCCSSCHNNFEFGYASMCEIWIDNNTYAEVCCKVNEAYEKWKNNQTNQANETNQRS